GAADDAGRGEHAEERPDAVLEIVWKDIEPKPEQDQERRLSEQRREQRSDRRTSAQVGRREPAVQGKQGRLEAQPDGHQRERSPRRALCLRDALAEGLELQRRAYAIED